MFTMKWWDGPSTRREGNVTFHAASPLYPMYAGDRRSFREAILFALGCLRLLWFRFDVLEADQFPNFHIFTLRMVAWIKRKPLTVTWHEVWGRDYWRQYLGRTAKIGVVRRVALHARPRPAHCGIGPDRRTVARDPG